MRYETSIKPNPLYTRIEITPLDSSQSPVVIKLNESQYQSLRAAIRAELAQEQADVERDNFMIMKG
jgi:hypothetical protein